MQKRFYNADGLRQTLDSYERTFGMDSETFMRAHQDRDEDALKDVPRSNRTPWASMYRNWQRIADATFTAHVERELLA